MLRSFFFILFQTGAAESLVTRSISTAGRSGVTGKRKILKESQAYPPEFGLKVGQLCSEELRPKRRRLFAVVSM